MFRIVLFLLTPLVASLVASTPALANDNAAIALLINKASRKEPVVIPAGRYDLTDLRIYRNVTLKGDGEVVFYSSAPVVKGILNPMPRVSLRVENITFEGAASRDRNGAGIRHDGEDLTVLNCRFIGNENGILSTGSIWGVIRIGGSEFRDNGHGDGYSHGVYVEKATRAEFIGNSFVGTRIGHHIKSLAEETIVSGNTFDDADGRASYAVDASHGGEVTIKDNTLRQAADADNPSLFNYDLTRGGKARKLAITGNNVMNAHPRGNFLRNDTDLTPILSGNTITNEAGGSMRTPAQSTTLPSTDDINAPSTPERSLPERGASLPIEVETLKRAIAKRSGRLVAPDVRRSENEIAAFLIANDGETASEGGFLTFGLAFSSATLDADTPVAVRYGDVLLPAQIDAKARHADGSIRHAAITVATPLLEKGKSIRGALVASDARSLPRFDAASVLRSGFDAPLRISFLRPSDTPQFALDIASEVATALADENSDRWLDGALAREVRITRSAAPHLDVRIDARVYRNGSIRVSIAFSNEKAFTGGSRDLLYNVALGDGDGAVKFASVPHHRASVWRTVAHAGTTPQLRVIHDIDSLVESTALAPVDRSLGADASAVAELAETVGDPAPLAPRLVEQNFPTTGGRIDIGPLPRWTALHLVAQTAATEAVMLANAEAAGAIPWHFLDDVTGAPIDTRKRRKFWADERGLEAQYAPDRPHPDVFASSAGGWSPDHAHKPALTYVPYLITADRFYADELAMQAAWSLFGRYPPVRADGLKTLDTEQVRDTAWTLRDLSDAAFILPDEHLAKPLVSEALKYNLAAMRRKYVDEGALRTAGEAEGYIEEFIDRDPERISPWQQDYVAISLALAAQRGNADASVLLDWMTSFLSGRFLSDSFDIRRAAAYRFAAHDGASRRPYPSWAQINARTSAQDPAPETLDGDPDIAFGYVASAYGALAATASETGSMQALEAFGAWVRATADAQLWKDAVSGDPRYLAPLRLRDGSLLSRADILEPAKNASNVLRSGDAGDDQLRAGDKASLLFGFEGADTLDGGAGPDDLFGGPGADAINGGDGDDRLSGGPGDDTLTGGAGADLFAFYGQHLFTDGLGDDVITDFEPARDILAIEGVSGNGIPPDARVADTPEGARISIPGGSVILSGVPKAALTAENFAQP